MNDLDRITVEIALCGLDQEFTTWKRIKPKEVDALKVLLKRVWLNHKSDCPVCRQYVRHRCAFGHALEEFVGRKAP